MVLNEWLEKTGNVAKVSVTFCKVTLKPKADKDPDFTALWFLDDYTVSSRAGDVIFLLPKNPQNFHFAEKFDSHVRDGDSIRVMIEGIEYTAKIHYDHHCHIDDDDCHNPDQTVTGCSDSEQEKLLAARKAYHNGEWFYCGIVISAQFRGVTIEFHATSLWGIEANYPGSDNDYLSAVANELLNEAIPIVEAEVACLSVAMIDRL